MNQSDIDQLMTLSPKGKPLAMKSNLHRRELRELGEHVQVWAMRVLGVLPKAKDARALQFVSLCLTNGKQEIFMTAQDFAGVDFSAAAAGLAYLEATPQEIKKAARPKKTKAARHAFRGITLEHFADVLYSKLPNVTKKTRFILVTFDTAENLGVLDLHDLDPRVTFHPVGPKVAVKFIDKGKAQSIEFLDLSAFFPEQELGEVAGRYNMTRLLEEPTRPLENELHTRAYLTQDARLTWGIFADLRGQMLKTWGVDPAIYRTPASCALHVYTSKFLQQSPGAVTKQVRLQAMRCYWGGRIEAFFRGRFEGQVCVYDAVSLYPQACINLGALPTAASWYRLTDKKLHTCTGGLCTVSFEFPEGELHPCLPVHVAGRGNYYPLKGISHCTVHEIRYALECGAEIQLLEGWGYDAEKGGDTSLAEYSRDLLARKNQADSVGDYSARTMFKLMLNSLYGKFGQKHVGYDIDTLRQICREYGYPDIAALENSPNWQKEILAETGEKIEPEINVPDSWYPEWAALINGYARYIESKAMRDYVALTGTIDSVILSGDAGPEFEIDGVTFKREVTGDTLVSIRARLYAVTAGQEIKKVALHGVPMVKGMAEQVAQWQGQTELKVSVMRVRQLREGLMCGQPVGKEREKIQEASTDWDNRRELVQGYSQPFPFMEVVISSEQMEGVNNYILSGQ